MGRRVTPELGEVIELMYPLTLGKHLAELIGLSEHTLRAYTKRNRLIKGRNRHPIGYTTRYNGRHVVVKMNDDHPQQHRRFAFAHVLSWEKAHGRKVPPGYVIVNLDGDYTNLDPDNLYCIPRTDLLNWARFCMCPVEVHVENLWRKVMALDTSEKVKQKLLAVLEQVVDPDQKPDLMRQRAACETVNTLIGLLRVEVAYLHAIEGDGVIPFLEEARQQISEKRTAAKKKRALLGPPADHPWRGLGAPETM